MCRGSRSSTPPDSSSADQLLRDLIDGDRRALGRFLTLLELGSAAAISALDAFPAALSYRVGFTGLPGAGKSTLIDRLIDVAVQAGRRPAVIAVDPSSPVTGGALLGDRIRMQDHTGQPDVFIRSMAGRDAQGGTAPHLDQVIRALALANFDPVMVETVGVGQGESAVRALVETLVLVITPYQGDEVQALKAGVLEVADVFCINHSDGVGAARARALLEEIDPDGRRPVVATVATTGEGVGRLWDAIEAQRP